MYILIHLNTIFDVLKVFETIVNAISNDIKHLQKMYMDEGLLGIYKLFPAKALALSISRFTYYFWYRFNTNQCKYFLNIKQLNTLQNITCGYLAGIFNTIFI